MKKASKLHSKSTEETEGKLILCCFGLKVISPISVGKIIQ